MFTFEKANWYQFENYQEPPYTQNTRKSCFHPGTATNKQKFSASSCESAYLCWNNKSFCDTLFTLENSAICIHIAIDGTRQSSPRVDTSSNRPPVMACQRFKSHIRNTRSTPCFLFLLCSIIPEGHLTGFTVFPEISSLRSNHFVHAHNEESLYINTINKFKIHLKS